jgi:tetratricopeptide (TPR) repeat protein
MATTSTAGAPVATTDFQRDLDRLDGEIRRLSGEVAGATASRHDAIRLVSLQYRRATLLGSWDELRLIGGALGALVGRLGPLPDLCLLQGLLDLTMHRLGGVRDALRRSPVLAGSWHGRALEADVLVQEGQYADARHIYEAVVREAPTWENLARLAHVQAALGQREQADRLYADAEEELTAKEMRVYAWVELMRGELDLAGGAFNLAQAHYERARSAYSGYWLVDAHSAELLGMMGRTEDAIALYRDVVARAPRPELIQALGDAYARAGYLDDAQACYDRALAGYLDSAGRREVHYLHHLADFYADVRQDGREAVRWAEADFALRPSPQAEATLAWAEYRVGRLADALRHIQHALASGASGARVLRHSETIHRACGDDATASLYALLADRSGPAGTIGHVHR